MPIPAKEKYSPTMLRQLFHYDPESGVVSWKAAQCRGRIKAGTAAGCVKDAGYIRIQFKGESFLAHRVAWAVHFGEWPDGFIDHINRDRGDNRISNLRVATHAENARNRPAASHNKTGLKGVQEHRGKFRARIVCDGERVSVGTFETAEEAHSAYASAAKAMHKEFASV